jgi:hypothetical protein
MDPGEILDGAFQLYRRHFRAFLAAGLVPLAPLLAFWAWVAWSVWSGAPLAGEHAGELTALLLFGAWLPGVLTQGTVIRMADDAQMGRPVRARAAFGEALRRLPVLLWASGLTTVMLTLPFLVGAALATRLAAEVATGLAGAALTLGCYAVLAACWAALAAGWTGTLPAVMLERTSGSAGRARSWALARGGPRSVLAVWAVGLVLLWMPRVSAEALLAFFTESTDAGLAFAVSALLSQAAAAFSVPLVAAARTLLFNDLRVRTEALDVRLLTERLAPAAA